ncbi:S8 family serine peptidase [Actinophytocola sp.]|uniref:S8 family serine peptidase n=1 Tax=Actinophytocola sp. TaxID=1872138 RepID=UPI002D4C3790|nr:S8 family serine peptidase [Actinophytocola sp.]HYQ68888.1 S8 family serine peptidase [Actinophytocola sp.]
MRIGRRLVLAGIVALTLPAGALPVTAAAAEPGVRSVTLITGDRVVLRPDGSHLVRPAAGRELVPFSTSGNGDHLYVVPADAAPLVSSGRLDERLFDVKLLREFGYGDRLPLIVTGQATVRSLPGIIRDLPAVGGVAMVAEPGFWRTLTARSAGVTKVWLDGKRRSTLDQSVPQIGAPAAWAAGYTGAGVKVAVLDTGVDQTHPDLAGEVAERNFSSAPDNTDVYGHGTHVAATIASVDAKYRGVAPGASLLDGKVLDDSGFGQESQIIAGMQWAAEQGARIANLSLGGTDTPELDPLEEAVNTLSARYGTLFVIAAGNTGADESVGSPGSADAALTVGAVDRQDNLAPFSSRGPRIGDRAIKPDITAPGVGIVAASHGDHVAMSGTSMATPHVSGAAALLAQQHPGWTGGQLKAALTGSAKPNPRLPVLAQGAGRVDVAHAITQSVVTEPASVSLGVLPWPHEQDKPISEPLTYRNLGATDVRLHLSVDPGVFSLSADELTVPAGGTAEVVLTGDTTGAADGDHTGAVVATAGADTVRTPVAITRAAETHRLTVDYLGLDGKPTTSFYSVLQGLDNWTHEILHWADDNGTVTLELPPGRYALDAEVFDESGTFYYLPRPNITLTADTTITVDARAAKPVRVSPPVAATLGRAEVGYHVMGPVTGIESGVSVGDLGKVFTAQSGPPAPAGTFVSYLNTGWTAGDAYYGLAWSWEDALPTGITKTVRRADLATVRQRIAGGGEVELSPDPLSRYVNSPGLVHEAGGPAYVTTRGVRWTTTVNQPDTTLISPPRTYRAGGSYDEPMNHAVFGPALPRSENPWVSRYHPSAGGDLIIVSVPLFGDSAGNAGLSTTDTASTRLYRGDELVGEAEYIGGAYPVPAEEDGYRLAVSATRSTADVSTEVSAEWTFRSAGTGDRVTPVGISAVRFTPRLDEKNTAPAGRAFTIPVSLQRADGTTERPCDLSVAVSYDEGRTWQPAEVANGTVRVRHPAHATSVSLRAFARDQDGNTVRQTIIRAYKLA